MPDNNLTRTSRTDPFDKPKYDLNQLFEINRLMGTTTQIGRPGVAVVVENSSTSDEYQPLYEETMPEKLEEVYKEFLVSSNAGQNEAFVSKTYDKLYDLVRLNSGEILNYIESEIAKVDVEDESRQEFLGELISIIAKLTKYTDDLERRSLLKRVLRSSFYDLRYGVVMYISKMDAQALIDELREREGEESNPLLKGMIHKLLTRLSRAET